MDYLHLITSIAFAIGAFLWYLLHKDNMQDQKEKWGDQGPLLWEKKFSSFMIIAFCIGACIVYMYRFLVS